MNAERGQVNELLFAVGGRGGQRSGSRDLDRAAVQAVSRWRFEPARDASGNPVAIGTVVDVDLAPVAITISSVDFPDPDSPINAMVSARLTTSSTPVRMES